MYYRYQPHPYHRRYYNLNPYYYYKRYYNPDYSIIDSQIATIDQNIINYGNMTDVYQDANIHQLRSPVKQFENIQPPAE